MEAASSKCDRVKLSPQATIDLMADLPIAPSFSEDLKKIAIESKSTLISVHARLKNLIIVHLLRYAAFRINGRVEVIDGSNPNPEKLQQREKLWFASSIKSRLQYLGPNPGIPCLSEQSPDVFLLDSSSGPVTTFCLLVLEPDQVDYLNLKSNQRIVPPCHRVPMEKCAGIQR